MEQGSEKNRVEGSRKSEGGKGNREGSVKMNQNSRQMHSPVISAEAGTGLEAKAVEVLKKQGLTITTAESCTGGLVAGRLISIAGASDVFGRGFVTYSNEAKEEELGVKPATLEQYSAVSGETVIEMAEGAAAHGKAESAIAVTGLAGPGGGTPSQPVGLVYIGVYLKGIVYWQEYHFHGTRSEIRELAVVNSLNLLLSVFEEMLTGN